MEYRDEPYSLWASRLCHTFVKKFLLAGLSRPTDNPLPCENRAIPIPESAARLSFPDVVEEG